MQYVCISWQQQRGIAKCYPRIMLIKWMVLKCWILAPTSKRMDLLRRPVTSQKNWSWTCEHVSLYASTYTIHIYIYIHYIYILYIYVLYIYIHYIYTIYILYIYTIYIYYIYIYYIYTIYIYTICIYGMCHGHPCSSYMGATWVLLGYDHSNFHGGVTLWWSRSGEDFHGSRSGKKW